jgi:hypothetical protein
VLLPVYLHAGGCGGDGGAEAAELLALAGDDRTVEKGSLVLLDGTDSDGPGALTYGWTVRGPDGSATMLSSADSPATTFLADREGIYVATLVVASGARSSEPDSAIITAENTAPTGSAGPDRAVYTGRPVTLEGSATDPTDDEVAFRWTIVSAPPGSAAVLDDPAVAAPILRPDQDGEYQLELVVRDGSLEAQPDRVVVTSYRPLPLLEHSVVDAEYSRPLDRLVMVSDSPAALHIHDPVAGTEASVALPASPTAVSVGPDGTHAAVGHDGWVSHVRLTDGVLLATHPVTTDVGDVVLAGNGYAYAMPRLDQWENIRSLDLSTGAETLDSGFNYYAPSLAKLHPSGTSLYVADPQVVSPSDISRWDISSGAATFRYDSPYHGDFEACGDLWMADDGLGIFSRCGVLFRSSPTPEDDLIYGGSIEGPSFIRHLDHSSVAGKVAVLPDPAADPFGDQSTDLRLYEDEFLVPEGSIRLPTFVADGQAHRAEGRFVFISDDGGQLFVIVQADAESGLGDLALVTYEINPRSLP